MNTFWFHFNKPASAKAGRPKISLHYKGKCLIVDNVSCVVSTSGKINKVQPLFVMKGKVSSIKVVNGIAYIS